MNRFTPRTLLAVLLLLVVGLAGCATTRTETKKDINVLRPGVARSVVVSELGTPVSSTTSRAGLPVDIFTFVQGTADSKKPPRPVEPEEAEATEIMALLEQSGKSPLNLLTGKKITVQVNYDAQERVTDTVLLRME